MFCFFCYLICHHLWKRERRGVLYRITGWILKLWGFIFHTFICFCFVIHSFLFIDPSDFFWCIHSCKRMIIILFIGTWKAPTLCFFLSWSRFGWPDLDITLSSHYKVANFFLPIHSTLLWFWCIRCSRIMIINDIITKFAEKCLLYRFQEKIRQHFICWAVLNW